MRIAKAILIALTVLLTSAPVFAEISSSAMPEELKKVGIEQNVNREITKDTVFTDENGNAVRLGDYFGKRPVLVAPVYYGCPMLCQQTLAGAASSFKGMKFTPGEDFEFVAVSFDPKETSAQAAAAKKKFLENYGRPETATGIHFLTGTPASIQTFTQDIGFRYDLDKTTGEYAHASMVAVLGPTGKIYRYFYGIDYAPKELKFAFIQASEGKLGTFIDQILLFCYHYDFTQGKYGRPIIYTLRFTGILTVLGMFSFIFLSLRKERRA
jgi:protein SCO1/2